MGRDFSLPFCNLGHAVQAVQAEQDFLGLVQRLDFLGGQLVIVDMLVDNVHELTHNLGLLGSDVDQSNFLHEM